jgi:hypothetical protein
MGSSLERQGRARFRLPGRMLMAGVGVVTLALVAGGVQQHQWWRIIGAPVKGGIALASSVYASNETSSIWTG